MKRDTAIQILMAGLSLGLTDNSIEIPFAFKPRGGVTSYRSRRAKKRKHSAGAKLAKLAEDGMCGLRGRKPGIVQQTFNEIQRRNFKNKEAAPCTE